MTQMIQPSDNALTANLSKLAGFIEQRAQQKKQIGQMRCDNLCGLHVPFVCSLRFVI